MMGWEFSGAATIGGSIRFSRIHVRPRSSPRHDARCQGHRRSPRRRRQGRLRRHPARRGAARAGEIWALYVRPEHWDKGIGVALWDAAREGLEEEGCTTVTIWVPIRNDRAMRFHELAGFKREMKTAKTTQIGSVRIEEIRLKRNVA